MIKGQEDRTKQNSVDTLAGRYLDSNNYQAVDHSISDHQTSTLFEMAVEARVQTETRMKQGVLALCSSFNDPKQYDYHFRNLRAFVESYTGKDEEELEKMLRVVLCHLYVDAWRRGAPKLAEVLLDKYGNRLGDEERRVLRESTVSDEIGKVEKIDVNLSSETASCLVHFVGKMQSVLLRNVIERCCNIRSCSVRDGLHSESSVLLGCENQSETASVMCEGERKDTATEMNHLEAGRLTETDSVRHLRNVISQVNEIHESSSLPTICLHTFYNVSRLGLTDIVFSPDSSLMCGTFEDSSVRLWNRLGHMFKRSQDVDQRFDSSRLSVNLPASLRLQEVAMDSSEAQEQENDTLILRGHSSAVYSASFTQDRQYLLSASGDTSVRLWDLEKQCNVALYKGHAWPVWDVALSPVDYYFATASFDRTARLWRTDATHPLRIFTGHTSGVNCVQFHPNCSYIATGSADGTCRLWSVQTGQYVRLFNKHLAPVRVIAFSPDGKHLVSASDDRKVLLWDIGTGNVLHEMTSHTDKVYTVDFSHDGLLLASSGEDGTIRLWNVKETGKEAACFIAKSCIIHRLQFSKNNLILSAGVHSPHR